MLSASHFASGHEDLVHDIAYDYYGKRMVTCSSDQKLKVWDHIDSEDKWAVNDVWKGHDSSILKVDWTHPEFGQVFASCSFDKTVRIWEEQDWEKPNTGRRWIERARLSDFRGTVMDIAFAPHHLGLKLATVATDGILRIYEAMDIVNLSSWTLVEEIDVAGNHNQPVGSRDADSHYCLSWCPSRFAPQALILGTPTQARIYRLDTHSKLSASESLPHSDVVTSVSWAPNVGRRYELIATGCRDGHVRIWKIEEDATGLPNGKSWSGVVAAPSKKKYTTQLMCDFPDHHAEVWRVEWNVTGTVLSSSGDDGKVRIWKASFMDTFACLSVISTDQTQESTQLNESNSMTNKSVVMGSTGHRQHSVAGGFGGMADRHE